MEQRTKEISARATVSEEFKLAKRLCSDSNPTEDGVLESKRTQLPVGASNFTVGLVCREIPFWFWTTSLLGPVIWIDRLQGSQKCDSVIHQEWITLLLAKPRTKKWGGRKRSCSQMAIDEEQATIDDSDGRYRYPATNMVFFDAMSPGPQHPVWDIPSLQIVVWWKSRPTAGPPTDQGWSTTRMRMDHGLLGGVTTRIDWVYIASKPAPGEQEGTSFDNWWDGAIESGLRFTSVRGIIDHTLHGRVKAVDNEVTSLMNRKMDWKRDKTAVHVLPSVFSPTGLVSRRLGVRELSLALDFPAIMSKHAAEDDLSRWLEQVGPPFKARVQVVHLIRRFLSLPRSRGRNGSDREESVSSTDDRDKPGMKECDEPSTLDDMDPSLIVEMSDELKDEDRNLKATKADDAEIPYHLWNDRILSRYGVQTFAETSQ